MCRRHILRIPVTMAKGNHLFSSRTQKLSLSAPKVLGWRRPGRIGRCRIFSKANRGAKPRSTYTGRRRGETENLFPNQALPAPKPNIFLLSSVGSSERLLTARSLVRVQQGEPEGHSFECPFSVPPLWTPTPAKAAGYYRHSGAQSERLLTSAFCEAMRSKSAR